MLGFTLSSHKKVMSQGKFSLGIDADSCLIVQPNLHNYCVPYSLITTVTIRDGTLFLPISPNLNKNYRPTYVGQD